MRFEIAASRITKKEDQNKIWSKTEKKV